MTASDDLWSERPAGSGAEASGPAPTGEPPPSPSRSDFPVRRGAPVSSRDGAVVSGRERFRADRNRSWAARRDVLPGGRSVEMDAAGEPVGGSGPSDLRVDRLEVVHEPVPERTGWPSPPPPSVAVPSTTPSAVPAAPVRPMPQSIGRSVRPDASRPRVTPAQPPADIWPVALPVQAPEAPIQPPIGKPGRPAAPPIGRADLADLLPRQGAAPAAPATRRAVPGARRRALSGQSPQERGADLLAGPPVPETIDVRTEPRRAAPRPPTPEPAPQQPAPQPAVPQSRTPDRVNPMDDLLPHPERRPYGVDLPTSADELFPPSTRSAPSDLFSRKPTGTSTGLQPRIFAPGTGIDESALPILVGDPVADADRRPPADRAPAGDRVPDGVRRFDLTERGVAPVRSDPRLPVPPAPPSFDPQAAWGVAPGSVGTMGRPQREPVADPAPVSDLEVLFGGPQPGADPRPAGRSPDSRFPDTSFPDTSFPDTSFPGAPFPGAPPTRTGHARRQAAEPAAAPRRGWAVPTVTAAIGLVAGIVFASSSGDDPATPLPTPAVTVTRTVTVTAPAAKPLRYPNCAAVRRAGVAPLHRGDPGYRAGLDPDGDGDAC